MPHELDRLFRPRSVAVVGASENDPSRMGTRTLHDLVDSGWDGEVFPVSSRHDALYGRRAYRSLRELPTAPDVVLVGNRPHVIRDAKLFAAQRYPVPIFIKQGINRWEYVGNYMVERYSTDPGELQSLRKKAARPHAVGALYLKKVE